MWGSLKSPFRRPNLRVQDQRHSFDSGRNPNFASSVPQTKLATTSPTTTAMSLNNQPGTDNEMQKLLEDAVGMVRAQVKR